MFSQWSCFAIAVALSFATTTVRAAEPTWSGSWDVTAAFGADSSSARMTLKPEGDKIEGSSGPLDENGYYPLTLRGRQAGQNIELTAVFRDAPVGALSLSFRGLEFSGSGVLYGVPVTVAGRRPPQAVRAPRSHDFKPSTYHLYYSARNPPALRIAPGDKVRTTTLDNEGQDQKLEWRGMPGNTLTGPFHIEGAMPGDTLIVHIDRVDLSRDSAKMESRTLSQQSVQGGYLQTPATGWDRFWLLDRAKGVARLRTPTPRLADLEIPLRPMIGSIGVSPPQNQALNAGDLGFHGGNLDFNRITAGSTLYLPVFRAGALLSLGDGHALQGDGEISGQGLETSLDIEFRVDLIKGWTLGQVWSEDANFVMVSGIDNSLDSSFQMATTGMARWLKRTYALNDSEVAALMSSSIEYRIAEVVDSRPHVVAMMSKVILARIRRL